MINPTYLPTLNHCLVWLQYPFLSYEEILEQVEPDEDTVYIPDNEQDAPPFQPCRSPTSMMQMAYNQTIPVEALQGTDMRGGGVVSCTMRRVLGVSFLFWSTLTR